MVPLAVYSAAELGESLAYIAAYERRRQSPDYRSEEFPEINGKLSVLCGTILSLQHNYGEIGLLVGLYQKRILLRFEAYVRAREIVDWAQSFHVAALMQGVQNPESRRVANIGKGLELVIESMETAAKPVFCGTLN